MEAHRNHLDIREKLTKEELADFKIPDFPALTDYDSILIRRVLYKEPMTGAEKELFKLLCETKEEIVAHLEDIYKKLD